MKFDGIDWLRGMAAFGIVGCHLALTPMNDTCWRIHDLCDMNVGLFAAVSGFLMWKPEGFGGLASYVRKRCSRLLPVYLAWTLVFMVFGFVFDAFVRHDINEKWLDWTYYPKVVFGGQISAHLWFLICLLYVQIFVGSVASMFDRIGRWGLLAIGFAISVVSSYYMDIWFFGYPVRMLGFVLTGYALRSIVGQYGICSWRRFASWLSAALAIAIVHYFVRPCYVPVFVKDWCLIIPLIVAFVAMPKIANSQLSRVGLLFGDTSMGVYLVHPIVTAGIGLIVRKIFQPPYGIVAVFVDLTVCWFIAFVCAVCLCKIPWTRRFSI